MISSTEEQNRKRITVRDIAFCNRKKMNIDDELLVVAGDNFFYLSAKRLL